MAQMPQEFQTKLADAAHRLTYACSQVSEEFYTKQIMLSGNMLIDAMNVAMENLNPKTLSDVEFAFQDVEGLTQELPPAEHEWFQVSFNTIRNAIKDLGFHVSLPEALTTRIRTLRGKIRERLEGIERASYAPPGYPPPDPPHPPIEMRDEAETLARELEAAGYETPMLDKLAARPEEFDNLDCNKIAEELDVILG